VDTAVGQIASSGILGALLVIALFALWQKDKELQREKNARIEDAKQYNMLSMSLQREVIQAVEKLSDIVQIWKQQSERDRRTPR